MDYDFLITLSTSSQFWTRGFRSQSQGSTTAFRNARHVRRVIAENNLLVGADEREHLDDGLEVSLNGDYIVSVAAFPRGA